MVKQSIIALMAGLLLISPTKCYGQEMMSSEQEMEIKASGKYYFGECIAVDETEAKECALKELTQEVIVGILQQALAEKKETSLKNLEMRANTAHLPVTGRIRILAYIAKDSIIVQSASAEIPPETIQNIEEQQMATKEELQPAPENLSRPFIAHPVVRDLADSRTFAQFRSKADSLRRQGKLVYGNRKTAFIHPENCHIAVFSDRTLIALLGEGNNSRVDLLTGTTIQNPEQHYSGNEIIWIQIN